MMEMVSVVLPQKDFAVEKEHPKLLVVFKVENPGMDWIIEGLNVLDETSMAAFAATWTYA